VLAVKPASSKKWSAISNDYKNPSSRCQMFDLKGAQAPFLKMDTQGYEWHVRDGAVAILSKVRGIQMELSLVQLYEGQRLWRECIERLEAEGSAVWILQPMFFDPITGRTLQYDGLFFRPRVVAAYFNLRFSVTGYGKSQSV
jgi:hypothetical protein